MATRTDNQRISSVNWAVDRGSIDKNTGRKIDWATVSDTRLNSEGKKEIKPGTVMSEQTNGTIVPRADVDDSGGAGTYPEAVGLLEGWAIEDADWAALSGYGVVVGGVVYENLLPDATGSPEVLPADHKTELAAHSKGFLFEQYEDTRV